MFTSLDSFLFSQFDAQSVSFAIFLSGKITPILGICFLIYIMLICFNFLRGGESNFIPDLFHKILMFVVILAIGVGFTSYSDNIAPILRGFAAPSSTGTSALFDTKLKELAIYATTDALNAAYATFNPIEKIFYKFLSELKAAILFIALLIFVVPAYLITATAKIMLYLCIAVGPIFLGFSLFPATRQYFSAWLNTVFSFILLSLLVSIYVNIAMMTPAFVSITPATGLLNVTIADTFITLATTLLLTYLLKYVSSLASSLSAGGLNIGGTGGLGSMVSKGVGAINQAARLQKSYQSLKGAGANTTKPGGTISKNKPG